MRQISLTPALHLYFIVKCICGRHASGHMHAHHEDMHMFVTVCTCAACEDGVADDSENKSPPTMAEITLVPICGVVRLLPHMLSHGATTKSHVTTPAAVINNLKRVSCA